MQRIIAEFKASTGIVSPPHSPREIGADSALTATYSGLLASVSGAANAVASIHQLFAGYGTADEPAPAPQEGLADEVLAEVPPVEVQPEFGSKVPCHGARLGQFRKLPSLEHEANMKAHVRSCPHACCGHVWKGPWGSFIGGADGTTHFDLTECDDGKRLNQLIGWDYEDPRC